MPNRRIHRGRDEYNWFLDGPVGFENASWGCYEQVDVCVDCRYASISKSATEGSLEDTIQSFEACV